MQVPTAMEMEDDIWIRNGGVYMDKDVLIHVRGLQMMETEEGQ